MVRRDTGAKETLPWDGLEERVVALLVDIQHSMLARAREKLAKLLVPPPILRLLKCTGTLWSM